MKRDCGDGELVPCKYEVVFCKGMSDDETELKFLTLELAIQSYKAQIELLNNTSCSDVRLYATDKQGYSNCIKMWICSKNGGIAETDRLAELTKS